MKTNMKHLFPILLALIVVVASVAPLNATPPDRSSADRDKAGSRPNFVVIFLDDLGYGDISAFGATAIKTPNIDSIGRDGMVMTSWYAGQNVCTPSRAALLTGRYAIRSGMQFVALAHTDWGLPPEEITVAEMLKDAGYSTGMVGKWHLGHRLQYWPTNQGFDSFMGVAYSNDMKPFDLYRGTQIIEKGIDQTTLSHKYADEAVRFINENKDEPFFLYYAENFPHRPLYYPPENEGRSDAGDYGDTIETVDDAIGRIMTALRDAEIDRNTIVIVTSDNGPWFQGGTGPWRGRKGETYEGGYRVPFLIRWPDGIAAGSRNDDMAMAIDILPTFAALAGGKTPEDRVIDGRDISAMWTMAAPTPHDYLYFFNDNEVAAVRDRRYRLVLQGYYRNYTVPFTQFTGTKLFDLWSDPYERYDISNRKAEEMQRLMIAYAKMRDETASLRRDPEPVTVGDDKLLGPVLQ